MNGELLHLSTIRPLHRCPTWCTEAHTAEDLEAMGARVCQGSVLGAGPIVVDLALDDDCRGHQPTLSLISHRSSYIEDLTIEQAEQLVETLQRAVLIARGEL